MNKRNIWIHLMLAAFAVTLAATIGELVNLQNEFTGRHSPQERQAKRDVIENLDLTLETGHVPEGVPEVLVRFRSDITETQIRDFVAKFGDRIEDEIESVSNLYAIDDLQNMSPNEIAEQYSELGNVVEYAEPNYEIRLDEPAREDGEELGSRAFSDEDFADAPNDPMFGEQWALSNQGQNGGKEKADIGALKAWLKTQGSEEVVVAVLDSGVDYAHQDLVTNMWFRPESVKAYYDDELGEIDDEHGYNADANSGDPMDTNGHGTHCAGVIGAEGNNGLGVSGINWKVEIMPLKFMGRGGFGTTKNAIEAINYAVDRKKAGVNVRVISASWGSTMYSKALEDAIRAAGKEGILFIAASGNSSTDNDRRPHYPSNYKLPNVISVAALDRADNLASFSNFGAKTVHIAAPGKDILSTWLNDQYREASGTSMATPQVSGVAALIVANEPDISIEDLRKRLLNSVDKLDSLNGKVENGGRLNAAKALGE